MQDLKREAIRINGRAEFLFFFYSYQSVMLICLTMKRAKAAAAMLLPLLISACAAPRITQVEQRDSVRVEYRERLVRDTVLFQVPTESMEREARDTSSHLETSYAESDASYSNGVLTHTLRNKPQQIPVPVVITVHDTTIVQGSTRTEVVTVPGELTRAQARWIRLGKWSAGILSLLALAAVAGIILKFAKR